MSKPASDIIDKWLGFTKVFSQKDLKVWQGDGASALVATLVLGPSIADGFSEEIGCKQSTVRP